MMDQQVSLDNGSFLRYADVDPSMVGKIIRIHIVRYASRVGDKVTLEQLDSEGNVTDSTITRKTFDYTIVEGTRRLKINTWSDGVHYCMVSEIEVVNE